MSWKNGAGKTREIARKDDDVGLVWRLSLATVTESGPFSLFPGLDRIIVLLEGDPMTLHFQDGETLSLNPAMPRHFSCDRPLHAELSSSVQCRDLNLLFRKKDLDARAHSMRFSGIAQLAWSKISLAICFAVSGSADVRSNAKGKHNVRTGDTLIFDNPDPSGELSLSFESITPQAQVIVFLVSVPGRLLSMN
jgi:environmental stress-induced protein Ves